MTTNATFRVDQLTKTTLGGKPQQARTTLATGVPCMAECATPKALNAIGYKGEKAAWVLTWRRSGVKAGMILTLSLDSKEYILKKVLHDTLGGYFTGVLEGAT